MQTQFKNSDMNDELIKIGDAKTIFLAAAKKYCGNFSIDSENEKVLDDLFLYLNRDERFNQQTELGLRHIDKGLLIVGNPGSGKTTILEIMQVILRQTPLAFKKKSTAEITDEFAKNGAEFLKGLTGNLFFDDLGFERTAVHYGDKRELMQDVIFSRYDKLRYNGDISHFTSMSSFKDLKEKYGSFAWSRLTQMCNVFVLGGAGNSTDRRKQSIIVQRPNIHTMPRLWITRKEYDEQMELRRIKETYKLMEKTPHVPADNSLGAIVRKALDQISPKENQ